MKDEKAKAFDINILLNGFSLGLLLLAMLRSAVMIVGNWSPLLLNAALIEYDE